MTLPVLQTQYVLIDQQEAVLHLSLHRPDCKNALSLAMYSDLITAFVYAQKAVDVRAVVISGQGGCFTSGNDLKDFMELTTLTDSENPILGFITAVINFDKPLIAAVDGVAYGIGTTLLLHCDAVIASPSSRFCLPFINLGLVPEFAASKLLPLRAGILKANEWLMSGEPFSAEDAFQHAVVSQLCTDPLEVATSKARELAAKPAKALQQAKRMLKQYTHGDLTGVINAEVKAFSEALASAEFAEAAAAFFEKRPPRFNT